MTAHFTMSVREDFKTRCEEWIEMEKVKSSKLQAREQINI